MIAHPPPEPPPPAAVIGHARPTAERRILCLDRDPERARRMAETVEALGHKAWPVCTHDEALERLDADPEYVLVGETPEVDAGGDVLTMLADSDVVLLPACDLGGWPPLADGRAGGGHRARPPSEQIGERLQSHLDAAVWRSASDDRTSQSGLTRLEARLLNYLTDRPGTIVTKRQLFRDVLGRLFDPDSNVLEVHLSRIRAKIDAKGRTSRIQTLRGQGFVFVAEPIAAAA